MPAETNRNNFYMPLQKKDLYGRIAFRNATPYPVTAKAPKLPPSDAPQTSMILRAFHQKYFLKTGSSRGPMDVWGLWGPLSLNPSAPNTKPLNFTPSRKRSECLKLRGCSVRSYVFIGSQTPAEVKERLSSRARANCQDPCAALISIRRRNAQTSTNKECPLAGCICRNAK